MAKRVSEILKGMGEALGLVAPEEKTPDNSCGNSDCKVKQLHRHPKETLTVEDNDGAKNWGPMVAASGRSNSHFDTGSQEHNKAYKLADVVPIQRGAESLELKYRKEDRERNNKNV